MMRLRSSDEKDSVSILEETLIDSSPTKEILEKKSGFMGLNVLDSGLNEEITSTALGMDGNVKVESVGEEDDGDVKVINVFGNNSMDEDISDVDGETKKIKDEEDGESDGGIRAKKGKRGRERKVVGSYKKVKVENDGVRVISRVLRSSVKMTSGSVKVDESRLNESVVGFKRQMKGKPKAMVVKTNNSQSKSKVAVDTPKICNVQNEDGSSEITGDNKENVKISEENNVPTAAEDTDKNNNTLKLENSIGGADSRRMEQQLVRDRIVSMIMKAGWTIEYRPRQNRQYLDAVYVDQKGKTHWSVTKAYFSLKSKIEKGVACNEEVSAFTSISNEELSVLFRSVSKVRSDKNIKKKKKKKEKNQCKAEIIITGVAQLKSHRKKLDKENKEKKATQKSAKRGPKVTQKDRQGRKPRLVARRTSKGLNQDNDDSALYSGKRNLLSWLIDSGVIMPGSKLHYGESRLRNGLLEGTVNNDGIHCSCCNEIMDISRFVSHGGGTDAQGLEKISLPSGSSLLKCLLEAWRKEEESSSIKFNRVSVVGDDPSDDTCNFCGDGGDLICCDGCPSTFHQSCLDIQSFPSGDWHCVYCSCKFCGLGVRGAAQMDDSHQPNSEMLGCLLCEEKFHHTCLQEDAANIDYSSLSFCGRKCQEIHERLQAYLGVKFELEEGFSWTLLKRSDVSQVAALLDDKQKVECNSKLAVAFSVMDECFLPIMDERSGVNRIHNVVYNCGSNFRRLDYSGFFTAILERGGELISVASIRIHGHQLAEMPFIGTRDIYRRQGMCRRLLDAIEQALSTFGVGKLIIPAIPDLSEIWTKVFGFKPLEESQRQEMKCMSMIVFPGTIMLQKSLLDNQSADKILSPVAEAAAAARRRMVLVKRLVTNNLEKMIQEALTYIQTREIERSDVYMDICRKLESAVDEAIAIDAVPSSSHIHQLFFIVKEVYRCVTELLQPSLIQLMLPIKAACRVGWFPDEDKKALLMMAKKVSYGFSTLDKMNSEPIDAHKCVSTIISRFYPTMKLENILTSFDVKAGLGIFVADFHISWGQLPHDCQNLRLLVARKDNMDTAACIASPLNVDFLINGSAVPKRTKSDMGNGPQLPTNVFKMIRYGVNLLQVSGDFDGPYIIAVASMNLISPPDPSLLQNYVINMSDRGDSECEVSEMSSQISLCCPISQCRIKVQVKGQLCKHRQCFDYKSFMEINSVTPTWRCPHCDKPVCHLDIRIDQDFLKILNKEADDVSDAIIPANSSRMVVMTEKSQSTEKNRNITSQKEGCNTLDTPMQPLPAGNLALQQLGREGEQRQYTAPAQSQANIGTSKQVQLTPSATTSLDLSRGEKQRHYTAPSQHQAELGTADQAHRMTLITSSATRSPPSIALTFEQLMGRDKQQDGASGQSDQVNVGTTNQTQSQRSSHSVALAIDQLRIEGEQRHFTPVQSHPAPASATTPIPPPTSSVRSISPTQLPEVSGGAMPSGSMRGSLTGKQRAAAQLEFLGQPRQPIRGNERWPLASLNQQPPPLTRFQNVSSSGNLPR